MPFSFSLYVVCSFCVSQTNRYSQSLTDIRCRGRVRTRARATDASGRRVAPRRAARQRQSATVAAAVRPPPLSIRRSSTNGSAREFTRMVYELAAKTRQTVETASTPTAGLQLEATMIGSGCDCGGGGGGGGSDGDGDDDAHNKDGDIVSRSSASDLTLVCFGSLPTGHGAVCRTHAGRGRELTETTERPRWCCASRVASEFKQECENHPRPG